jgi:hypothetical protein
MKMKMYVPWIRLAFIYKTTLCHNLKDHAVLNMLTGDIRHFNICHHIVP